MIGSLAGTASPVEKLTWQALYSLKQQEIDLSSKMLDEIDQIRDKFELLKQDVYQNMAKAASGEPVNPKLYQTDKKVNPKPLPDYWLTVFKNSGLV